jgi:O-antigen/teichoic acid export membrane protein
MSGSYYLLLYGVGVVGSVTELGDLRAAQTALGPVNVLLLAGLTFGLSESVRRRDDRGAMRRLSLRLAGSLATISLVAGAAGWALLPEVGPTLFDETWEGARRALPGLTAFCVTVAIGIGATVALRALGAGAAIRRWRWASGALLLSLGLPLAATAGPGGAFAALATAETLYAALAWRHLVRLQGTPSAAG